MGKGFFAGAGARPRKQFEQRAAPEKVQIFGVWMRPLEKTLARLSPSRPIIVESVQPLFIEVCRPFRAASHLSNSLLRIGKSQENDRRRKRHPPNYYPLERKPDQRHDGDQQCEADDADFAKALHLPPGFCATLCYSTRIFTA